MSATVQIPARDYAALRRIAGFAPAYVDDCHPKQRLFIDDKSKRKCALTSRRGGKSHSIGCWLLEGGEDCPRGKSLFIALTRGKAKSILWDDCLAALNERYKLGLRLKHDEGQLYIVMANGHRIWLLGVDNQSEVAKVRGERLRRAVVDEAQAFGPYLDVLIEEAIEPALMDLQGELALTGTPSPIATGYFWAATTGGDPEIARWPTHHWTVLDNPFLPHGRAWLQETKARNNWDDTHPRYRREFLGEWTEDIGALVYPLSGENSWSPDGELPFGLPPGEYSYGLGVDLGFSLHSTAFVLVAVRRGTGQIFILSAYTRSRLIPTALAAHVQGVRETVQKEAGSSINTVGLRVVVDEGALGKGYAEQMRTMGVACEPAQKTEKRAYQEFVRGLILTGKRPEKSDDGLYLGGSGILVDFARCRELVEECKRLQFDEETGLEDERYVRHCCFVAGTPVETVDGPRPIESLEVGDLVLTRCGPKRVTAAWCTGVRPTWRLVTESGREVVATGDHPIWVEDRFERLDALLYNDRLTTWSKPSCSTESPITDTLILSAENCASISRAAEPSAYIARSGPMPTGKPRNGTISTIGTAIRSTTHSRTSNAFLGQSTCESICLSDKQGSPRQSQMRSKRLGLPRQDGTVLKPVANGTASTLGLSGMGLAVLITCVLFAATASARERNEPRFAPRVATLKRVDDRVSMTNSVHASTAGRSGRSTNIADSALAQDSVVAVSPTGIEEQVYNITVEYAHEYFANGILVSNCDSMLYIVRAMQPKYDPKENDPLPGSAEALRREMAAVRQQKIRERERKARGMFG